MELIIEPIKELSFDGNCPIDFGCCVVDCDFCGIDGACIDIG